MMARSSNKTTALPNQAVSPWLQKGGLWLFGLLCLILPFFSPYFRDGEGFLQGKICLPWSVGVASLLLGWALASRWQDFAGWWALALVGYALDLQLINAGTQVRYQHYKSLAELASGSAPFFLALIGVQALLVALGLRRHWRRLWAWRSRHLRIWQLLLLGGAFCLVSTTLSAQVSVYLHELILASLIQLINLGNVLLLACTIPPEALATLQTRTQTILGQPTLSQEAEPGGVDRYALLLALAVTIVAALLNLLAYDRHPHVPDEVAYLIHANFFAHGAFKLPAPPVPRAFDIYLMEVQGGSWYPAPPPGWSLILAIGAFLGVPWLVNPILAGINVLLAYCLIRELYPRLIARVAIFLLAISPWQLFLSMSFMTHTFTLTCALLATLGVAWARRTGQARWAGVGGLALGMIALIRPLDAVGMAGLLGLWVLGLGGKRLKFTSLVAFGLGVALIGSTELVYNALLTGHPLVFPINAYTDRLFGPNANAYGFGPDRGMGWALDPNPGHSPTDALINSNLNISVLNTDLLGWSIGSLLLVLLWLVWGQYRRSDWLMVAVIGVFYTLHFFYYFSGGPDFGARYWFLMIVPLVVLAARGLHLISVRLTDQPGQHRASVRPYVLMVALTLMTLINFVPWRAIDKYPHFRGMRADIRDLAASYHFGASLVLVRGDQDPDYASAIVYNPLDLQAPLPIYVWDRDASTRAQILAAYPNRPVWLVDGPTVTGRGFVVVAGPLTAAEVAR